MVGIKAFSANQQARVTLLDDLLLQMLQLKRLPAPIADA